MFERERKLIVNLNEVKSYCKNHVCSNCALAGPADVCFFDHTKAGSPATWDFVEPREPRIPSIFPVEVGEE